MRRLVENKPDIILRELQAELGRAGQPISLAHMARVVKQLGLRLKKSRSTPPSATPRPTDSGAKRDYTLRLGADAAGRRPLNQPAGGSSIQRPVTVRLGETEELQIKLAAHRSGIDRDGSERRRSGSAQRRDRAHHRPGRTLVHSLPGPALVGPERRSHGRRGRYAELQLHPRRRLLSSPCTLIRPSPSRSGPTPGIRSAKWGHLKKRKFTYANDETALRTLHLQSCEAASVAKTTVSGTAAEAH